MISPIQQNVVFKGDSPAGAVDNFTGAMSQPQSVRGDYQNALNKVDSVQENVQTRIANSTTGNNLDVVI